jgi:hypothetical protein
LHKIRLPDATGSRIAGDGTNCLAIGCPYTSDDIRRTGATTAGDALQLMDPSITVHRQGPDQNPPRGDAQVIASDMAYQITGAIRPLPQDGLLT